MINIYYKENRTLLEGGQEISTFVNVPANPYLLEKFGSLWLYKSDGLDHVTRSFEDFFDLKGMISTHYAEQNSISVTPLMVSQDTFGSEVMIRIKSLGKQTLDLTPGKIIAELNYHICLRD